MHVQVLLFNIESVDSISWDDLGTSETQYITNAGISCARYTVKHSKHHHHYLRETSYRLSIITML